MLEYQNLIYEYDGVSGVDISSLSTHNCFAVARVIDYEAGNCVELRYDYGIANVEISTRRDDGTWAPPVVRFIPWFNDGYISDDTIEEKLADIYKSEFMIPFIDVDIIKTTCNEHNNEDKNLSDISELLF